MDPDLNFAKIQDPDPNSIYFDPQHCFTGYPLPYLKKEINNLISFASRKYLCTV